MRTEQALPEPSSWGICPLGVVPVRKEANDRSEMVNQLLFGELYQLLEIAPGKKWYKIQSTWDGYQGWLDGQQHQNLDQESFDELRERPRHYAQELNSHVWDKNMPIRVPYGASLPYLNVSKGSGKIAQKEYTYPGQALAEFPYPSYWALLQSAFNYLNTPYLWGGRSVWGCDCSGFTQQLFQLAGLRIPRDAYQQAEEGEAIHDLGQCQGGELAFFAREGRIVHVGLVLKPQGIPSLLKPIDASYYIMHALGKIRIDVLDKQGIYHQEKQYYTHRLHSIRKWSGLFLA